ncbi:hypothetical protein PRIPAC_75434, partial [Pristionchus pacificus]|uniref:Uncharacterized protein n=1 Tax=Pristionchus pacificus TaxID=54126 RepID=A0A2A6C0M0_PRIPA
LHVAQSPTLAPSSVQSDSHCQWVAPGRLLCSTVMTTRALCSATIFSLHNRESLMVPQPYKTSLNCLHIDFMVVFRVMARTLRVSGHVVEISKWLVYAMSSYEFRRAVLRNLRTFRKLNCLHPRVTIVNSSSSIVIPINPPDIAPKVISLTQIFVKTHNNSIDLLHETMTNDHKDYAIAKCIIITLCMTMSIATITTVIKTKQLRGSPIFCSVGYAISTNFIENLVVFYAHDFPSAMVGEDLLADENPSWVLLLMIQMGDTRPVAQAGGRGFSKLVMEESGGESGPPVASARMENGEWRMERGCEIVTIKLWEKIQFHGCIAFIAMTKWFAHMMNLLTMTAYYVVLLYDFEWFQRVRPYRFSAMIINTIVGALFAFPYVFSEFYGFTLESISWSYTNSESMNSTGNHFKAFAVIYASISWMFLVILTLITAAAGTVMFVFICRARKRSTHPTTSHKSFQILENEIMLISAFFGITLAYYIPVLSFNLTPLWYSEHSHALYEVLDIFEDLVENTKWKLYAFSSSRFRVALARTFHGRKGTKVKPVKIFVTTRGITSRIKMIAMFVALALSYYMRAIAFNDAPKILSKAQSGLLSRFALPKSVKRSRIAFNLRRNLSKCNNTPRPGKQIKGL